MCQELLIVGGLNLLLHPHWQAWGIHIELSSVLVPVRKLRYIEVIRLAHTHIASLGTSVSFNDVQSLLYEPEGFLSVAWCLYIGFPSLIRTTGNEWVCPWELWGCPPPTANTMTGCSRQSLGRKSLCYLEDNQFWLSYVAPTELGCLSLVEKQLIYVKSDGDYLPRDAGLVCHAQCHTCIFLE